tara:strand:+ start:33324 stop:33722 length:399 start_codon:yes stop_codon:yes gene_type:complete
MSITFFKWVQYLQRREITKFIELYSKNTILVPKIEPYEKPSLINPYPNDTILHGRVGAFKNFENIFFSHYREFKITNHQVTHLGNNGSLFAECNFYYKGFDYNLAHNMTLTKENSDDKIVYHFSTLKRLNEL